MSAYRPISQGIARTIADSDKCSLKRLAWAYGCAPKGSSEEKQLELLLLRRAEPELEELAASWSAVAIETLLENSGLRAEVRALRSDLDEVRQNAMERDLERDL